MNSSTADTSTYGLVTELCKKLLEKHSITEKHPYIPQKDYTRTLKKFRSKAYGILLNKSAKICEIHGECDSLLLILTKQCSCQFLVLFVAMPVVISIISLL